MRLYDEELRVLLTEVVKLLCRKRMNFESKICVEGLLGVTLDEDSVFWLKIDDSYTKNAAPDKYSTQCTDILSSLEQKLMSKKDENETDRKPQVPKTISKENHTANQTSDVDKSQNGLQVTNDIQVDSDKKPDAKELDEHQDEMQDTCNTPGDEICDEDKSMVVGNNFVVTENESEELSVSENFNAQDSDSQGTSTPVDLRCLSADGQLGTEAHTVNSESPGLEVMEAEDLSLPKKQPEENEEETNATATSISKNHASRDSESSRPDSPQTATTTSQGSMSHTLSMAMNNPFARFGVGPQFGLSPLAMANHPFAGAVNTAAFTLPLQVPSVVPRMAHIKTPTMTNRAGFSGSVFSPTSMLQSSRTKTSGSPMRSTAKRHVPADPDRSCSNCGTRQTTLWRTNELGQIVCNACGLYFKLHKKNRPVHWAGKDIATRRRKKNTAFPSSASGVMSQMSTPSKTSSMSSMATLQQMLSASPLSPPSLYNLSSMGTHGDGTGAPPGGMNNMNEDSTDGGTGRSTPEAGPSGQVGDLPLGVPGSVFPGPAPGSVFPGPEMEMDEEPDDDEDEGMLYIKEEEEDGEEAESEGMGVK